MRTFDLIQQFLNEFEDFCDKADMDYVYPGRGRPYEAFGKLLKTWTQLKKQASSKVIMIYDNNVQIALERLDLLSRGYKS